MNLAKLTSVCVLGLSVFLLCGSAVAHKGIQKHITGYLYRLTVPSDTDGPLSNSSGPPFAGSSTNSTTEFVDIEVRYPDLNTLCGPGKLPRGRVFSAYQRDHMRQVEDITIFIMKINNETEVIEVLGFLRNKVNEQLFLYVVSVLVLVHPQMAGINLPLIQDVLPNKFITCEMISEVRQDILVNVSGTKERQAEPQVMVLDQDFTGSNLNPEHRVAYWREDIGLSAHHWHWHVVYFSDFLPISADQTRDRKGELFYFMHAQLLARHNSERLASRLARIMPLKDWSQRIPEGYVPHLGNEISGVVYAPRPADMLMKDVPGQIQLNEMQTWYDHIVDTIDRQQFLRRSGNNFQTVSLNDESGIDTLGNMLESNAMSPDLTYYGDLHNMGHVVLSRIQDPTGAFKTEMGAMGDLVTAMRDPVFYRWHLFIDDIYVRHKRTLPTYSDRMFNFQDVDISSVVVTGDVTKTPNKLVTYWQSEQLNLAHGLDFRRRNSVTVRFQHLQHENFKYTITVNNKLVTNTLGMVRIFWVPTLNEAGEPFDLEDQRRFFIEMDRFPATFTPGNNVITRLSSESAVILPSRASFAQPNSFDELGSIGNSYCTCGLAEHLLVPRGTEAGMQFQMFVMISNGTADRVVDLPPDSKASCKAGVTLCGILNRKYPDSKPMGFPFDRPFGGQDRPNSIGDLAEGRSNMFVTDMKIRHVNQVFEPTADTSSLASATNC